MSADGSLAGLLIQQWEGEEAERLRRFGLNPDGSLPVRGGMESGDYPAEE